MTRQKICPICRRYYVHKSRNHCARMKCAKLWEEWRAFKDEMARMKAVT
jgi:hypothetical protein